MKISTASMPIIAAFTPGRIEQHAGNRGIHSLALRIPDERRPHRALFEILNSCRERARAQDHGQILGLLLTHAAAADFAGVADGLLDVGNFLHLAIEHHAETFAHMRGSETVEALSTLTG